MSRQAQVATALPCKDVTRYDKIADRLPRRWSKPGSTEGESPRGSHRNARESAHSTGIFVFGLCVQRMPPRQQLTPAPSDVVGGGGGVLTLRSVYTASSVTAEWHCLQDCRAVRSPGATETGQAPLPKHPLPRPVGCNSHHWQTL